MQKKKRDEFEIVSLHVCMVPLSAKHTSTSYMRWWERTVPPLFENSRVVPFVRRLSQLTVCRVSDRRIEMCERDDGECSHATARTSYDHIELTDALHTLTHTHTHAPRSTHVNSHYRRFDIKLGADFLPWYIYLHLNNNNKLLLNFAFFFFVALLFLVAASAADRSLVK